MNNIKSTDSISLPIVYLSIPFIILNPYFSFSALAKPGFLLLALIFLMAIVLGYMNFKNIKTISKFFVLMLIPLYSSLIALVNNKTQYAFLLSSGTTLLLLVSIYSFAIYMLRNSLDPNKILDIAILSMVANSILIFIELFVPALRIAIESLLIEGSNLNFSEGYRLRGLASNAGASLSVGNVLAIIYSYDAWKKKRFSTLFTTFCILILFLSLLLIGRTGLLLAPLLLIMLFFDNYSINSSFRNAVFVFFGSIGFIFLWPIFESVLLREFGQGYLNWAYGFILEGEQGFAQEGTLQTVIQYLFVLPETLYESLFGTGFYGGQEYDFYTDSGLARTFLAVGYPMGLLFYAILFLTIGVNLKKHGLVNLIALICLCIAEVKESMILSGSGSRIYTIAIAISYANIVYSQGLKEK